MPNIYRSILGQFLGPGGDRILLRIVAVDSYYFHLIEPLMKLPQVNFDSVVNQFAEDLKGVAQISPGLAEVTIPRTSPQDGIRSIIPQMRTYREQYRKFFAKNKVVSMKRLRRKEPFRTEHTHRPCQPSIVSSVVSASWFAFLQERIEPGSVAWFESIE